jgi:ATP-dependent DNA helicase RecG
LANLGIFTVFDLLYYFPFRYDDFRRVVNISDLQPDELVTIKGKIELINNRQGWRGRRRRILTEAIIVDTTGSLRVIWFNQPYLIRN